MFLNSKLKVRQALTALFLSIFTFSLSAQEWIYEGPKNFPNDASDSWIDDAGNSYHNISRSVIQGSAGTLISRSLLILDINGNFNGRVQINSCRNRSSLLPFGDGLYLTNDFNCNESGNFTKDSRVFDHKGNLVLTGEGFSHDHFASVKTNLGYTTFNQSIFKLEEPVLEIRTIDWDFNIESREINLSELKLPHKHMVAGKSILPVETPAGHWVVLFSYGMKEPDNASMFVNQDILVLTDGASILKTILFNESNEKVYALQAIGNDIAVVTGSRHSKGPKKVLILDEELQVKEELTVQADGYFDRFLITPNYIVLLNNHFDWGQGDGDQYIMHLFDRNGKLLNERLLKKNRMHTRSLMPFGETGILLSGVSIESDSLEFSVIWKMDLELTDVLAVDQIELMQKETVKASSPVADLTVDNLSGEAMSVAVFPNPASIYINFALKNPGDGQRNFLLRVFSMDGKEMHQANFQNAFYELDIAHFPPGTYSYLIVNQADQKEFLSGKFIKSR